MQTQLVAGETLNYRASAGDYPAGDGWALKLVLNPRAGGVNLSIDSAPDGSEHLLQASAATTATWTPGLYGWEIWAILGTEKYRLEAGQIRILPSLLSAVAGTDTRSDAEIALDAVRQMIGGTATAGVLSYRINDRELRRYGMTELLELQSSLANEVRREQDAAKMAAGLRTSRKVYVRMGRA